VCVSSEVGGAKALVVGAFAEHSADVHALVDGLAEEAIPRTSHHYLVDPSKAKGAAKALLYAALGGHTCGTHCMRAEVAVTAGAAVRCATAARPARLPVMTCAFDNLQGTCAVCASL
jgi:hypothetical protein